MLPEGSFPPEQVVAHMTGRDPARIDPALALRLLNAVGIPLRRNGTPFSKEYYYEMSLAKRKTSDVPGHGPSVGP